MRNGCNRNDSLREKPTTPTKNRTTDEERNRTRAIASLSHKKHGVHGSEEDLVHAGNLVEDDERFLHHEKHVVVCLVESVLLGSDKKSFPLDVGEGADE